MLQLRFKVSVATVNPGTDEFSITFIVTENCTFTLMTKHVLTLLYVINVLPSLCVCSFPYFIVHE